MQAVIRSSKSVAADPAMPLIPHISSHAAPCDEGICRASLPGRSTSEVCHRYCGGTEEADVLRERSIVIEGIVGGGNERPGDNACDGRPCIFLHALLAQSAES